MQKISSGLLMYRIRNNSMEFFLVHPGGPFWKNQDRGAWGIPKGQVEENENLFDAAKREFFEETGIKPSGNFVPLGRVTQKSGKIVHAWAFEGDWSGLLRQNIIKTIWNGKEIKIPEVDKAGFFSVEETKKKRNPAQFEFVERLREKLKR